MSKEDRPLSYRQFSVKVKELEANEKDNYLLLLYVGLVYLLCGSINYAGRITMSLTYQGFQSVFEDGKYLLNPSGDYFSMANVQWIFQYASCPVGLQIISFFVMRCKFRLLMFISALSPQFIFLVTIYYNGCQGSSSDWCNSDLIYTISILLSLIGGVFQGLLFIGMLFYLTNISSSEDKPIYYAVFFLVHNFQWIGGSLIGQIIYYFTHSDDDNQMNLYYYYVFILNFLFSLLFFGVSEPSGESRLQNHQKIFTRKMKQQKDNENRVMLQQMLLNSIDTNSEEYETNLALHEKQQSKKYGHNSRSLDKTLSLQYFSMEESELMAIDKGSFDQSSIGLTLDESDKKNYWKKLFFTWRNLSHSHFDYLISTIILVSFIQVFITLDLFKMIFNQNSKYEEGKSTEYEGILKDTFQGILYFGIGLIFGCFAMGTMGDFKDKIRGLISLLILLQGVLILGYFAYSYYFQLIISIYCSLLGFCDAAISSTIISMLVYEYPNHIYLVDLVYVIYSWGIVLGAAILIFCNYTSLYVGFGILQIIGLFSLISVIRYSLNKKDMMQSQINGP